MIADAGFELPPEQQALLRRARRLEWGSIAYTLSGVVLLYLTMGTSQAMRTSFFENAVSVLPAFAFLMASRIAARPPNPQFPYGYHSAVSIGYLTAALVLAAMGAFLLIEAAVKLAQGTRTTIGGMTIFGETVWAGWPMLLALAYTCVPSFFLGRIKLNIAPQLHDKVLFADAKMMKADWMSELATGCGVIGVGLGFWWADALAALLVSLDILYDGVSNIGRAVSDLIHERPRKTDGSAFEPLQEDVAAYLRRLDWVEEVEVRLRENGHVFFGEAFVRPRTTENLVDNIEQAVSGAKDLDWRLHELVVMPVDQPAPMPASASRAAASASAPAE